MTAKSTYVAVSATSGGTSVVAIAQEWSAMIFGVPLSVPLAGFAGTLFARSFIAPASVNVWRGVLEVFSYTVAATYTVPLGLLYFSAPISAAASTCFFAALLLQWGLPWLSVNREKILDDAFRRFFGRPGDKP